MKLQKITTLNLRYELEWNEQEDIDLAFDKDAPYTWAVRRQIVADYLLTEKPDIICFQEAQPGMLRFLEQELGQIYGFCGEGRLAKTAYFDELTRIAYNKSKFRLLSSKTFWLSETPEIPGSALEGQHCNIPRICTKARFMSINGGEEFMVYNTHFCLVQRIIQWELDFLEKDIAKQNCLCFLCGDLNETPEKLIETYNKSLHDLTAETDHSFHCFGQRKSKIDYILCNQKLPHRSYVSEVIENGIYISDHFPVSVILE